MKGTCEICGEESDNLHRHHISYERDSTVPLCPSCHREVHSHPEKYPAYQVLDEEALLKISLRVSNAILNDVDRYAEEKGYTKRSEALRDIIAEGVKAKSEQGYLKEE